MNTGGVWRVGGIRELFALRTSIAPVGLSIFDLLCPTLPKKIFVVCCLISRISKISSGVTEMLPFLVIPLPPWSQMRDLNHLPAPMGFIYIIFYFTFMQQYIYTAVYIFILNPTANYNILGQNYLHAEFLPG